MINFLRISNDICFGKYLHSNGSINDSPSSDVIGICVIPSNFLPDKLARFMSIQRLRMIWNRDINIDTKYRKRVPGKNLEELDRGFLSSNRYCSLVDPYLSDGSFNPKFLKDLPQGNAFQDYKGYENTEKYKKEYGDSDELYNAFSSCFELSSSYRKSEWYLPAIGELALLYEKKSIIDTNISPALVAGSMGILFSEYGCCYWSSSECSPDHAWYISMYDGYVHISRKNNSCYVRAFLTL